QPFAPVPADRPGSQVAHLPLAIEQRREGAAREGETQISGAIERSIQQSRAGLGTGCRQRLVGSGGMLQEHCLPIRDPPLSLPPGKAALLVAEQLLSLAGPGDPGVGEISWLLLR